MKFTKEDYDILESEINSLLSKYSEKEIIECRKTVKFVNDQFVSFCWLIFWEANKVEKVNDIARKYFDDHIETAIKKILEKYKNV